MPDRMPEAMPDRMLEDMPDRMPEGMPERMPDKMSDRLPEDMPEGMPERMPDKISDRMPEDMPVTKRINVMVGITRSKVIFQLRINFEYSFHVEAQHCLFLCEPCLGLGPVGLCQQEVSGFVGT